MDGKNEQPYITKCWSCDGTGIKAISLNAFDVEDVPCPACGGSGIFMED